MGGQQRRSSAAAARIYARVLDPGQWTRILLVVDLLVLYLGSAFALLIDTQVRSAGTNLWLALTFPVLVVAIMRARRSPD